MNVVDLFEERIGRYAIPADPVESNFVRAMRDARLAKKCGACGCGSHWHRALDRWTDDLGRARTRNEYCDRCRQRDPASADYQHAFQPLDLFPGPPHWYEKGSDVPVDWAADA